MTFHLSLALVRAGVIAYTGKTRKLSFANISLFLRFLLCLGFITCIVNGKYTHSLYLTSGIATVIYRPLRTYIDWKDPGAAPFKTSHPLNKHVFLPTRDTCNSDNNITFTGSPQTHCLPIAQEASAIVVFETFLKKASKIEMFEVISFLLHHCRSGVHIRGKSKLDTSLMLVSST